MNQGLPTQDFTSTTYLSSGVIASNLSSSLTASALVGCAGPERIDAFLPVQGRARAGSLRDFVHETDVLELQTGFRTRDPAMRRLLQDVVYKIAPSEYPVLILGDTGTGKELLARAIHDNSPRSGRRLVDLNCAALNSGLLESELFGHVKGAFTGAVRDKEGKFREADGGTLFLDELGDMSLEMQAKLLRILETQIVEPVGGDHCARKHVDVRLVAATSKDLGRLVRDGRFRRDLYYRLEGLVVRVPRLSERTGDVEYLTNHFLAACCSDRRVTIEPHAMAALNAYSWPGNVRELKAVVEGLALFAIGGRIGVDDVWRRLAHEAPRLKAETQLDRGERYLLELQRLHRFRPLACSRDAAYPGNRSNADRHGRELMCRALELCDWDISEARRLLAGEGEESLEEVVDDRLKRFLDWLRSRLESEDRSRLEAAFKRQHGRYFPSFLGLLRALETGKLRDSREVVHC